MKRLTITLCVTLGFTIGANAQVSEQDSLALVALYNATEGTNWAEQAGWLSESPCSWYGVSCTDDMVTELLPDHNRLSGPIPPELGKLSNLWWVELDQNRLSGALPAELGQLSNVQLLDLGANQFSGAIPPELGNLAATPVRIWLYDNQLSGEIPPELGKAFLIQLWLQDNQLSGSIPPELGALTNLEDLRLHRGLA